MFFSFINRIKEIKCELVVQNVSLLDCIWIYFWLQWNTKEQSENSVCKGYKACFDKHIFIHNAFMGEGCGVAVFLHWLCLFAWLAQQLCVTVFASGVSTP